MNAPGSIIRPVAVKLLGEPDERLKGNRVWKYGNRGSLVLDLIKGEWYDHEAGTGGGVLELVIREIGGDHGSAGKWLTDNGFAIPVKPRKTRIGTET